jgi:hypothetical protein
MSGENIIWARKKKTIANIAKGHLKNRNTFWLM